MTYVKKFKFNSCGGTRDSYWNVGYPEMYCKVKKVNFVLYGVKIGVFHDSELNKSICFGPKPLLGGKAMHTFRYLQTPLICICII